MCEIKIDWYEKIRIVYIPVIIHQIPENLQKRNECIKVQQFVCSLLLQKFFRKDIFSVFRNTRDAPGIAIFIAPEQTVTRGGEIYCENL